jgi:hypothetical protein
MSWATFLLMLISGYVAMKLLGLSNRRGRLKFLGLTIAATLLTIMQASTFLNSILNNTALANVTTFIVEWGHIVFLALVLSSLAVFIRESKPVFAQFPMLYTALPLLIVFSYILVYDTYALKNWLIAIYQGGAILVSLLMYSVYTYHRKSYAMVLAGVGLFVISYLLFWYVPGFNEAYHWVWKLLVGSAMLVTVLGYEQAETQSMQTV